MHKYAEITLLKCIIILSGVLPFTSLLKNGVKLVTAGTNKRASVSNNSAVFENIPLLFFGKIGYNNRWRYFVDPGGILMSYQALYRAWRPDTFTQIVG